MVKFWYIWDFPCNIYLRLEKSTHEEFFNEMFVKVSGKRPYARFLGVSQQTVKQYYRGYTYKNGIKYQQSIPISLFKKSLPLINNKLKEKIENNILLLKAANKGTPLINPKLPFKESPEFYRIAAHMIGDGSAPGNKVPYYANTCKELREQFKKDLKVFGEVKIYEKETKTVPIVCFPKVITDILSSILNIKFTHPDHIPKIIFRTSDECKSAFLRALYDDEGCSSNGVVMGMKSSSLMKELKDLSEQIGIKSNKLFKSNNGNMTSFSINSKYIELFKKKIGFTHPNKIKNLDAIINRKYRKQRTRSIDELKIQILKILEDKSLGTVEVANNIQLTLGHTLFYLKLLEKENKVIRSGFKNKIIWNLSKA